MTTKQTKAWIFKLATLGLVLGLSACGSNDPAVNPNGIYTPAGAAAGCAAPAGLSAATKRQEVRTVIVNNAGQNVAQLNLEFHSVSGGASPDFIIGTVTIPSVAALYGYNQSSNMLGGYSGVGTGVADSSLTTCVSSNGSAVQMQAPGSIYQYFNATLTGPSITIQTGGGLQAAVINGELSGSLIFNVNGWGQVQETATRSR